MVSCSAPRFLTTSLFLASLILRTTTTTHASNLTNPETQSYESDRIVKLPGQPSTPSINHFSGYITVNQDHGRALFYWFFEAQSQPSDKPLVLWLNGGPGCSSIGYGAAIELGPLRVNTNGTALLFNNYAWNQEVNLLFVESPVGVGFSYTNTSSDLTKLDDAFVAEDAYNFLANWLQRFPHFRGHELYLAGESYAGHYVPQLAELVYDRNKDKNKFPSRINLKGFIVGNAVTDDHYDYKGLLEYAWSHSVVSDEVYDEAKRVCDFKVTNWSVRCNELVNLVFNKYGEIDIYNIYAPKCLLNTRASSEAYLPFNSEKGKDNGYWKRRIPGGGYDPCFDAHAQDYFNRADVQSAFHVKKAASNNNTRWEVCNASILEQYNFTTSSILPIYTKLIKGGLKIWVYSGDTDGRVPVIGTRYWVEALGLPLKSPWRSWFHQHQVGGRMVEYEGLSVVTIRGAGHLVPLNKPSEALAILHSFLTGQDLPKTR